MKKVTNLIKNECIHCKTKEEAKLVLNLMHESGLKWSSNRTYLEYKQSYDGICYFPFQGSFVDLKYATIGKEKGEIKIFEAEEFLK